MTDLTFNGVALTDIETVADFLAALAQDLSPSSNVAPGTANYAFLRQAAAMHMWETGNWGKIQNWWNWQSILADPANAPDTIVDLLLSNFNASRTAGVPASGTVAVVLSSQVPCVVSVGTIFTFGTQSYVTTMGYTAVVNASDVVDETDCLLVKRSDGNWQFTVSVTASTAGAAGNIPLGTALAMSPAPAYLIGAFAAQDFVNGTDAQTNADLAGNALDGMSAKIISNRTTAAAAIGMVLPGSLISVIGMGSDDMYRDQRGLLGNSIGGRADVYLRSGAQLQTITVTATGTATDSVGNYSIALGRDSLAGAVTVWKVCPAGAQTVCSNIEADWDVDLSNASPYHDLETEAEAAFSCYQSVEITFTDPTKAGTYDVYLLVQPGVGTAQAYIDQQMLCDPMADWVVKSAVPIIVNITMTVKVPVARQSSVDTTVLAAAAAAAVNGQSFVSELNASLITSAVQQLLPAGSYVRAPIDMIGQIIPQDRPVGTLTVFPMGGQSVSAPGSVPNFLRSGDALCVPVNHSIAVSPSTVAFFTDSTKITINMETL